MVADDAGPASQTILVVGGGIAGITAALEAADCGHDVVLMEKGPSLGGRVTRLERYFPKLCHPTCGLEINYQRIRRHPRLSVMTMCEPVEIAGARGAFRVTAKRQPRFVNAHCTACGDCARATSTLVANPHNYGLDRVKAAYLLRRPTHHHFVSFGNHVFNCVMTVGEGRAGHLIQAFCRFGEGRGSQPIKLIVVASVPNFLNEPTNQDFIGFG